MFGRALIASVRPDDLVSRIGGDEFVILLTHLSNEPQMRNEEINLIIKTIQTTLLKGWSIKENSFTPTTSIGISFFPDHGSTIDELLEKADIALYQVKRMGKNQHLIYLV